MWTKRKNPIAFYIWHIRPHLGNTLDLASVNLFFSFFGGVLACWLVHPPLLSVHCLFFIDFLCNDLRVPFLALLLFSLEIEQAQGRAVVNMYTKGNKQQLAWIGGVTPLWQVCCLLFCLVQRKKARHGETKEWMGQTFFFINKQSMRFANSCRMLMLNEKNEKGVKNEADPYHRPPCFFQRPPITIRSFFSRSPLLRARTCTSKAVPFFRCGALCTPSLNAKLLTGRSKERPREERKRWEREMKGWTQNCVTGIYFV